jgi:oligoendopeptidase F
LPKQNKQTGAYSISGIKGLTKYYISMNYDKTFDSLKTLVHELGHSLNSHYVNKHQEIYTSIPIFYAEVSSITNEMLLSYYLLKKHSNNKELRIMLYDELLSNFFNTTTRQIVFSHFEYLANE